MILKKWLGIAICCASLLTGCSTSTPSTARQEAQQPTSEPARLPMPKGPTFHIEGDFPYTLQGVVAQTMATAYDPAPQGSLYLGVTFQLKATLTDRQSEIRHPSLDAVYPGCGDTCRAPFSFRDTPRSEQEVRTRPAEDGWIFTATLEPRTTYYSVGLALIPENVPLTDIQVCQSFLPDEPCIPAGELQLAGS